MSGNIAELLPAYNYAGELTLAGTLRKYWSEISSKWNTERTITGNIADYEKRILAVANPHKGINHYTMSDFEKIVNELSKAGDYALNTIAHYQHLLRIIQFACLDNGEQLDETVVKNLMRTTKESEIAPAKKGLLKSFTRVEVLKILKWIQNKTPGSITGPELGVILMFFLGLRNQEAAATKFINHYKDKLYNFWMLSIIWTMRGKTREVKTKGKTQNAHRIMPCVIEELNVLINARKSYIKQQTGISDEDVKWLPICCSNDSFYEHCTYEEINVAAKKMFADLKITGNTWASIMEEFVPEEYETFNSIMKDEKDPTAYLCRRHAATMYYGCILSESDIQYVMGHEIEDPRIERVDYMNEDLMLPLISKLKMLREVYAI